MMTTGETRMNVGSSFEEMTQSINEYLDPALSALHTAFLHAFAKHPTLSLYKWLHAETLSYLQNAASAGFNATDYLENYCTSVQHQLSTALETKYYKNTSERKKELFNHLINFYKNIIIFKLEIGKKILAVNDDDVTRNYIDRLGYTFESVKNKYINSFKEIYTIHTDIENDFSQLTHEKIFENIDVIPLVKNSVNKQLASITTRYETTLTTFNEPTVEPSELLVLVQNEIKRAREDKIQEEKINLKRLINTSPMMNDIVGKFIILKNHEEDITAVHENKKNMSRLDEIFNSINDVIEDLLRQKSLIHILSAENVKPINLDESIELLRNTVCKQADRFTNREWCSEKKGSVIEALVKVKDAGTMTYIFGPVCNAETLQDRFNHLNKTLCSLEEKIEYIDRIKIKIKEIKTKTEELNTAFEAKKIFIQQDRKSTRLNSS